MFINFIPGNTIEFEYRNHEGMVETRSVQFEGLGYGTNEWYPSPTFFINGLCSITDKRAGERRSFAITSMLSAPRKVK